MARWRTLAAVAAIAAVMMSARGAAAYCRSTTCDTPENFASCSAVPDGCQPLAWKRSCLGWTIQEDASKKVPYDVVEEALTEAFGAWQTATCDNGLSPGIQIEDLGPATCPDVEYNSLAGNANVVVFRDNGWPHEGGDHNIALTTVTYDVTTGEIFDGDIEVNSGQFELTWGDTATPSYDLVSIFTHEVGHFLGLSHSSDAEATMYRHYEQGTTDFRALDIDDQKAVCALYPPQSMAIECNPIPRHGFSPDCAAQQTEGKCSASPGLLPSGDAGRGALPAVLALAALSQLRGQLRGRLKGRSASRTRRARPRP